MAKTKAAPETSEDSDAAPAKPKKPMGLLIGLLVAGLALGGGGASAYFMFLAPPPGEKSAEAEEPAKPEVPPVFINVDRMTVPMLDDQKRLVRYVSVNLTLAVDPEQEDFVKPRLPMVRHGINQALSTRAVSQKDNDNLLDYDRAEAAFREGANEALGKAAILSVKITSAMPI